MTTTRTAEATTAPDSSLDTRLRFGSPSRAASLQPLSHISGLDAYTPRIARRAGHLALSPCTAASGHSAASHRHQPYARCQPVAQLR